LCSNDFFPSRESSAGPRHFLFRTCRYGQSFALAEDMICSELHRGETLPCEGIPTAVCQYSRNCLVERSCATARCLEEAPSTERLVHGDAGQLLPLSTGIFRSDTLVRDSQIRHGSGLVWAGRDAPSLVQSWWHRNLVDLDAWHAASPRYIVRTKSTDPQLW